MRNQTGSAPLAFCTAMARTRRHSCTAQNSSILAPTATIEACYSHATVQCHASCIHAWHCIFQTSKVVATLAPGTRQAAEHLTALFGRPVVAGAAPPDPRHRSP